ncbi:MAG TPA: type II CAAX endopeptidase family protein [Gaiellaceae bacterium]|nr:type II CAAX endopeptidase family protein [Gaiellaceae bacterium]
MRRHKTWPAAVWLGISGVLVFLAFLGASQSSGAQDEDILFDPTLAIGGIVFYGLLIGVSLAIASAYPRRLRYDALGFRRFRWRWLWISFAVVVATTIVAVAVEPFLHGGEDQGLGADRWQPDRAEAFAANVAVLVLLGPFAEELFFRGLGVRVLAQFGGLLAILVTGVIFGLVHGLLGALPPLVLFGIGLAWVRLRSASVWPPFIAHAVYNGLGILVLAISWAVETPAS